MDSVKYNNVIDKIAELMLRGVSKEDAKIEGINMGLSEAEADGVARGVNKGIDKAKKSIYTAIKLLKEDKNIKYIALECEITEEEVKEISKYIK